MTTQTLPLRSKSDDGGSGTSQPWPAGLDHRSERPLAGEQCGVLGEAPAAFLEPHLAHIATPYLDHRPIGALMHGVDVAGDRDAACFGRLDPDMRDEVLPGDEFGHAVAKPGGDGLSADDPSLGPCRRGGGYDRAPQGAEIVEP